MSTEHNLRNTITAAEATIRNAERQLFLLEKSKSPVVDKKAIAAQKRAERYKTKNGLTIDKLIQAGNTVRVSHIRYMEIPGTRVVGHIWEDDVKVPVYEDFITRVPVPTFLRGHCEFTAKGGSTYVVITTPEGDIISRDSHCHELDSFDYKLGVKNCLDQIKQEAADDLLIDIRADYHETADSI